MAYKVLLKAREKETVSLKLLNVVIGMVCHFGLVVVLI